MLRNINSIKGVVFIKIQQIEYAVEVAKAMSFSAAAENLYVSQPNISRAILTLEQELGYAIFLRTNQGIALTEEGEYFISRATVIAEQLKDIMNNKQGEKSCIYRIKSTFHHTSISEAFIKICNENINCEKLNISFTTGSVKESINDIYLNRVNLGIAGLDDKSLKSYSLHAKAKGLELVILTKQNMFVNLRKGHPLLKEGVDKFNFEKLREYVHITYDNNANDEYPGLVYNSRLLLTEKVIAVSDKETRRRLVSNTDAFSIGVRQHKKIIPNLEWVSIPLPDMLCYVVYIKKEGQELDRVGKRFLQLILEEIE